MSPAQPCRVSVILPVRNAALTIERAVLSIRMQTMIAWELIAVDDGSDDGTAEILAGWARQDARLRVLRQPPLGIVAALTAGLAAARGELVARMDADDEAHPQRLELQAAMLAAPENRAIGLVGCLVDYGGDRGAQAGYARHVDWINTLTTSDEIALSRFVESPFAHPSVMFRRELAERHGGYRAGDFPEDYELWLRWLEAGVRMAKVPRVLLRWNDPPGRLSRTDPRYSPEAFFRMKAGWIAREVERRLSPAAGGGVPVRSLWVWGAGRLTRKRASHLEPNGIRIAGYIDVDAKKATSALGGRGVPVRAPADLPPPGRWFVLGYVSKRGARDYVRTQLVRRGYGEGRDFLMCA